MRSSGSRGMRISAGLSCRRRAFDGELGHDARVVREGVPGFDQALAQIAYDLHQEGAAAHGHVADLEVEQFASGFFSFQSIARGSLGRTDVDKRLERVLDDRLGQALGRVMRAGGAAGCAGGDVDAARWE